MKTFLIDKIKRLSNLQEAIIVVTIALGLFIYSSIRTLITISTGKPGKWEHFLSEYDTLTMLGFEIFALGLIAYLLSKRGWRFKDLNLNISIKICLQAIALIIVTILLSALVSELFIHVSEIDPQSYSSLHYETHKTYWLWSLMLIINSFFEEFIYVGYLSRKLEKYHRGVFILVSSVLRVIIHLYQGVMAILVHFTMGLVFATTYTKYQRLMMLVIAHTLWNLLVLLLRS